MSQTPHSRKRSNIRLGLRLKLLAVMLLLGVLPLVAFVIAGNFISMPVFKQSVGDDIRNEAQRTRDRIDRAIKAEIDDLRNLGKDCCNLHAGVESADAGYDGMSADEVRAELVRRAAVWAQSTDEESQKALLEHVENFIRHDFGGESRIINLVITDRHGGLIAAKIRPDTFEQAGHLWWRKTCNERKGAVYVSAINPAPPGGRNSIDICVPITRIQTGEFLGVLRAVIDAHWLYAFVDEVRIGKSGHAHLMHSSDGRTFHSIFGDDAHISVPEKIDTDDAWFIAETWDVESDHDNQMIRGVARLRTPDGFAPDNFGGKAWYVVIEQKAEEPLAFTEFLVDALVPALAVILLLVLIAGLLFSRALTHPLEQLRASEQRLDLALKGARMGLWEWDIATGKAVFNERFAEMLGYSTDEIPPDVETWRSMIHPDDVEKVIESHRSHFRGADSEYRNEYRLRTKSGEWIWVIGHARVVKRDETGKPAYIVSTLVDITERKQAETELLARANCEQKLAQCSHALLTAQPPDTAINEALKHMLDASGADRAYIFENFSDPQDGLCTRQRYEICAPGIEPLIADPTLQHVIYDRMVPGWRETMVSQGLIQGLVKDFPKSERVLFEVQGIKSLLSLPIVVAGEWFGFVGFDDCTRERIWSDSDIGILQTAAEMIGMYFERKRTETLTTVQRDLAVALGGIDNLDEALNLCLDTAITAAEMDCGGIYLVSEPDGSLDLVLHRGLSEDFVRVAAHYPPGSAQNESVRLGKPVYAIYEQIRSLEMPAKSAEKLKGIAIIPVTHEGRVIACLNVASHTLEAIPTTKRNILETIAAQIGGVIAHLRAEQKIQQLATMVEQAGEGVVACDLDGNIMFHNAAFARMHGYDNPDELVGKHMDILHTPQHMSTEVMPLKDSVIKNEIQSGIIHHLRKDGSIFPAEATANVIKNEKGDPIGVIVFLTDITERLKAEEALRHSEERLDLALKGASLGLWDWDIATGKAVFNERWAQMLGYTLEEIQMEADAWKNLVHPDDTKKVNRNVEDHWKGLTEEYETEHRLRSKSGEWVWVLSRGKVVQRDEDGRPIRMVGTHLDITERKKAEAAVKEERDRAQHYLDVAGVILISISRNHAVTLINRAGCRILECEEKDILGKDWFETFLPPEIRDEVSKVFDRLMVGEVANVEYFENEIVTAKGRRRIIAWHNSVLRGEDGTILATLGSGEDITERRMAQENLQRSERMFRGIYDNANDGICLVDAETKAFFMCNAKFRKMMGYTEDELQKMSFSDFHPAEARELVSGILDDIIAGKSNIFSKDVPMVKKGGIVFYSDISSTSVSLMNKKYLLGLFRDSTERRHAEHELMRQRDFVTTVIETTPAFFVVVDHRGNTVHMNRAILETLDYKQDETVGKSFLHNFVPKHEWKRQVAIFNEYIKSEKPAIYDCHVRAKDGTEILVEWHSRAIYDSGRREKQFFAIGLNVTERRKLENQLLQAQKMQTLGTLAGGVAHDYNNLLVGVLGFASLISASPEADEKTRAHARQIEHTAQRMADLTKQLLGFGRGGKWTTRVIDVNDTIRETARIVHGSIRREISLQLRLSPQPSCIEGDPGQILQVVTNCCINAIEATGPDGKITIKTSAKYFPRPTGEIFEEWKPGDYVHIEIADTGSGMNRGTLARMFEPYFSTKGQGRGLGMAAVFGIIKNHHGWLAVETESGAGTRIHIYLPHVEGPPQKLHRGDTARILEKSSGKIIVVDDELVVRQLCRDALRKVGYNVLTAHTANQGLRMLEKHPDCKLLLLDMVLPRPGGRKVFEKARKMYPNLKILITSGHDDHGDISALVKQGAAGFLAKPFTGKELAARIAEVLNAQTE